MTVYSFNLFFTNFMIIFFLSSFILTSLCFYLRFSQIQTREGERGVPQKRGDNCNGICREGAEAEEGPEVCQSSTHQPNIHVPQLSRRL